MNEKFSKVKNLTIKYILPFQNNIGNIFNNVIEKNEKKINKDAIIIKDENLNNINFTLNEFNFFIDNINNNKKIDETLFEKTLAFNETNDYIFQFE